MKSNLTPIAELIKKYTRTEPYEIVADTVLIVGDIHAGVSGDSPWHQHIISDAWDQIISYCVLNNIKYIIQTGDMFDVQKAVTQVTMNFVNNICEKLNKHDITMFVLVGNHDMHFKSVIYPNSCTELLTKHENIIVVSEPMKIKCNDAYIDLIPWLCDENKERIFKFIAESESQYCVGHWELTGFYFYKGLPSTGMESDFLKRYDKVYSGHFHTMSNSANVQYVGTPITLTRNDDNDTRGFWAFNPNDGSESFIPNHTTWHKRIDYPSSQEINVKDYKNLSVRLVITDKTKESDKLESQLEKVVYELKTQYHTTDFSSAEQKIDDVEIKTMFDIYREYVNGYDDLSDDEKETIYQRLVSLHIRSENGEKVK